MYYFDDGNKFSSKIDAHKYSLKNKKDYKLYYFDEAFSSIDWTVEPIGTLEYHYKQQAQRIRDEYDYVILCYSGGADSTNILETYVYNNIKLDKIVIVGAFDQDSTRGVDENHNGELYHNAFPYLKQLGLEHITQVCDYTSLFDKPENFSIYNYGNNWVDVIGTRFSPHNWFWRDIDKYVVPKELKDKKVAIVLGREKPYVFFRDDNGNASFGFRFSDTAIFDYGNSYTFENCDRINFYWDQHYPFILIKQMHVLKRHFLTFNNIENKDEIIYNLKRPLVFKSPKSQSIYLSLRDNFLINKKNSSIYKFYFDGLHLYNKRTGMYRRQVYSKFYHV
jgi:hypothetical protein